MTDFLVATAIFSGIALFTDAQIALDLARVAGAFALAALLATGSARSTAYLFGFFPTWKNVWSVFSRPLLGGSGIFFLYEAVPPAFQGIRGTRCCTWSG